jgi:hypothetical protein
VPIYFFRLTEMRLLGEDLIFADEKSVVGAAQGMAW